LRLASAGGPGPTWPSGAGALRNRWRFCTALAIAVALHLGVAWLRAGGAGEQRRGAPARVLETRFLSAPRPEMRVAAVEPQQPVLAPATEPRTSAEAAPPQPPVSRDAARREPIGANAALPASRSARSSSESTPPAPAAADPGAAYALASGLDPGPRPIGDIDPEYPESAHLQEGTVVLRLLISETGVVDRIDLLRAEPKGLFEASALEAFGKAKFYPGLFLGTAVKSQITVEVHFLPINRGQISGRGY
jgi:protein TonB